MFFFQVGVKEECWSSAIDCIIIVYTVSPTHPPFVILPLLCFLCYTFSPSPFFSPFCSLSLAFNWQSAESIEFTEVWDRDEEDMTESPPFDSYCYRHCCNLHYLPLKPPRSVTKPLTVRAFKKGQQSLG